MKRKKEFALVLDVETCGSLDKPIVYDIGYLVIERKGGNIVESGSLAIRDVFLGMRVRMETAYYAKKLPQYWRGLKNGKWTMVSFWNAKSILRDICEYYGITKMYAYNADFDFKALNNTTKMLTGNKYQKFLPYTVEPHCIWHMACQTIYKTKKYHKFCIDNHFVSASGNIQTSAEVGYAYLKNQLDFEENHTGLEDCKIENMILQKCFGYHKRINETINRYCWQLPQRPQRDSLFR